MLEWNVFVEDFNAKEIKAYNIFEHGSFMEDLKKIYKKNKGDRENFDKELIRIIKYYFWAKCEWEVIISDWPPSKTKPVEVKVDVFDQIMLNREIFLNYVWNSLSKRKK